MALQTWIAKAALRALRAAGYEVALEIRAIKTNEERMGVLGRRIGVYTDLPTAQERLATTRVKPGWRVTLGLRAVLGERLGAVEEERKPPRIVSESYRQAQDDLNRETSRALDNVALVALPALEIDPTPLAAPQWDPDVPSKAVIEPKGRNHKCDKDGPMMPFSGEYQPTCSICGERQ